MRCWLLVGDCCLLFVVSYLLCAFLVFVVAYCLLFVVCRLWIVFMLIVVFVLPIRV